VAAAIDLVKSWRKNVECAFVVELPDLKVGKQSKNIRMDLVELKGLSRLFYPF